MAFLQAAQRQTLLDEQAVRLTQRREELQQEEEALQAARQQVRGLKLRFCGRGQAVKD